MRVRWVWWRSCMLHLVGDACSVSRMEKELKALGGDVNYGRGSMLHLILTLCHKLEKAFTKLVDGGRDGGWRGGGVATLVG